MTKTIFLIWSTPVLLGSTLYVATGGNDANPGTIDQPLARISKAVSMANPGDTIIVRDGVYGPEGRTDGFPVWITRPGTPNAWITLKAEHKGNAILDCQNDSSGVRTGCDGYIYLDSGAAYWVLQDLVFEHGYTYGASSNSTPSAHDILVRGCRFEYIGRHPTDSTYGEVGVYTGPGSYNFTFDSNSFHDIGRTSGAVSANDHGLYLHSASTSVVNNVFYAPISGWGIQTASGFSGMIANNTFAFPMQNTGGQLMLWDINPLVTVRNNIFYNPGGRIAINSSSLSVTLGCSIDHNLVIGGTIGSAPGCFSTTNSVGDPAFVNAVSPPFDFHLAAGSPAIGAGAPVASVPVDFDGVTRPSGNAPDLGAYQYVAGLGAVRPNTRRAAPTRKNLVR